MKRNSLYSLFCLSVFLLVGSASMFAQQEGHSNKLTQYDKQVAKRVALTKDAIQNGLMVEHTSLNSARGSGIMDCTNAIEEACALENTHSSPLTNNTESYGCSTFTEDGPEQIHVLTLNAPSDVSIQVTDVTSSSFWLYLLSSCDPNDCYAGSNNGVLLINANMPAGTYYIVVEEFIQDPAGGSYNLSVECDVPPPAPENDDCTNAIPIGCDDVVLGSTEGATTSGEPVDVCGDVAPSAGGGWYSFVGNGNPIELSLCNFGTDYDTQLHVYEGDCGALSCVAGNDDGDDCSDFSSELTFVSTSGVTYYILVNGFGTETGNFELTVNCCPIIPDITSLLIDKCTAPPIMISWDAIPEATQYQFFGQRANTGNPSLMRTVTNPGFNVPGNVPNGFNVEVQLRAKCQDGTWGEWTDLTPYSIVCNPSSPVSSSVDVSNFEMVDGSPLFDMNYMVDLYPNPVNDVLNVSLSSELAEDSRIEILDVLGQVLLSQEADQSILQIDMNAFQKGHYIVSIQNGDTNIIKKIVKQ